MEPCWRRVAFSCLGTLLGCASSAAPRRLRLVGCASSASPLRPWPDADQLFRRDASFRGADSAYSVDLGDERVLWLFGDTFVGSVASSRAGSVMIHNSVAIAHGYDPTRASIAFYFGRDGDRPDAFFRGHGKNYWWPGPGVRVDGGLLLTFVQVAGDAGGLGFKTVGSRAIVVRNPEDEPPAWRWAELTLPATPGGARFGTGALFVSEPHLYGFFATEPGDHDVYLSRWPLESVAASLSEPQWYSTARGWTKDEGAASPVVRALQTEFSVHRDDGGQLRLISTDQFGAANIVERVAPRPEGPWSSPRVLLRPQVSRPAGVFVYSGKAHPELRGGSLVVTYCTNHADFWTLTKRTDLYYRHFVRAK